MSTDRRSIGRVVGLLGYHDMPGTRDSKAEDWQRGDAVGRCAASATAAVSAISLFFLLFVLLRYVIHVFFFLFLLLLFKREKAKCHSRYG